MRFSFMRFAFVLFLFACSTVFAASAHAMQIPLDVPAPNVEVKPQVDDRNVIEVTVNAGEIDRVNEIVNVRVQTDRKMPLVDLKGSDGSLLRGQLSTPSLNSEGEGNQQLTFVIPQLAAGETVTFTAGQGARFAAETMKWEDDGVGEAILRFDGDQNVMKYMYAPIDETSEESRMKTYKVYHHVYSPDGEELVTKGPGGKFPHHRGLFYGFNKISYDGKKADVWHCKNGAFQSHEESVELVEGPVFGRNQSVIDWNGTGRQAFRAGTPRDDGDEDRRRHFDRV